MEQIVPYLNTLIGVGIFGWIIRAERRLAVIETTCKIKNGGCNEWSKEDA